MEPKSGLKQNLKQFSLLILINAFVGGMIGMERSIFPDYAREIFGLESQTAMLSFIMAFGVSKAIMNYYAGRFSNLFGRRNLLLAGWFLVLPVPLILNFSGSWIWVVCANLLLGASQGLTWSSTVVMKIDLVGPRNRGLAMGLNEFAGYLAVGIAAVLSASLASKFGIRPVPFLTMEAIAISGLFLSFFAKDTKKFIHQEILNAEILLKKAVFWNTTFKDKALSSVTQAGLVNNLNDGMIWGLLPVLLISKEFELSEVGGIVAIYPIVWGFGQLFTGKLADHFSHKWLVFWGMLIQGLGIMALFYANSAFSFRWISIILGLGTALVYPTFMTAIAASSHPFQRAESLGVFRFWRDLGYAIGALISGIIADQIGVDYAILAIGVITIISSFIIEYRMPEDSRL